MRRYGRVALGGTFDRFHVGHEALLATAFRWGGSVAIGLTSRRFLASHPKPEGRSIAPEASRRRALSAWLRGRYPARRWAIVPLDDRYGGAVERGVDALVVSVDTVAGGRAVNRERWRRGLRSVPLLVVPLVLADDLEPVSSRRIRTGEIDRWGHRRGRIEVGLIVGDEVDRGPSLRGIARAFPRARVEVRSAPPRARALPLSARRWAARAARQRSLGIAVLRRGSRGWFVGIHGGHGALDPRPLPGTSPGDLSDGLARLLRPARPR